MFYLQGIELYGVRRLCWWTVVAVGWAGLMVSCRSVPCFPEYEVEERGSNSEGHMMRYDTHICGAGGIYEQERNESGRTTVLRFGDESEGDVERVVLDEVEGEKVPHVIIALDGVPFEVVEEMYEQGWFRLFYRPGRVISCFPGMTDLAFWRLFGGEQPRGYQTEYYDPSLCKKTKGNEVYLSGENAGWAKRLDYRAPFLMDALMYLCPAYVFGHELRGMDKVIRKGKGDTVIVYSVGTAGLGTRLGRRGMEQYLKKVDRFCEQIVYEKRGRVKISLLADHGQNMRGRGRVRFDERLAAAGYDLTDRLRGEKDVVGVSYGLVTYADFVTKDPEGLAEVLAGDERVDLVLYKVGGKVWVQKGYEKGWIERRGEAYRYVREKGDPLVLERVMESMRRKGEMDAEGFADDECWFAATSMHEYPDPLRRSWEAFDGLVRYPADVIVTLKDGWYHGWSFFDMMIGKAVSTHGSLNRVNSTTFVMTMLGEVEEVQRLEEVMGMLERLRREGE